MLGQGEHPWMKITELVKTYKLLSDPNAPEWNVKFVGGVAIAALVVAGAAGALWFAASTPGPEAPAATASEQEPAPETPCSDEEKLRELAARRLEDPAAPELAPGTRLPSGCVV